MYKPGAGWWRAVALPLLLSQPGWGCRHKEAPVEDSASNLGPRRVEPPDRGALRQRDLANLLRWGLGRR